MTWQIHTHSFADVACDDWSDDVADDCAELLAWLMTGCWRGGSTRFSCRQSGEDDAWRACREWSRVGSAVVGACWRVRACRTSVLRRVFSSEFVSSSSTRWYVQKHVWRTLIFEFGSNTLFFKNKLSYQLLGNSRTQTHTNLRGSATCLLHGATGLY
jgi:hypothetical protein